MHEDISLFANSAGQKAKFKQPLADKMRPQKLTEMVGQEHLLGPGKPLRQIIDQHIPIPLILWGPPVIIFNFMSLNLTSILKIIKLIAN